MSGGEVSGVDLARQVLLAAREAARKNGATAKKPKRRTTTVVRRDGREPLGLGSAIGMMMTEHGMATPATPAAPATGGSILADFDTILTAVVPELAERVQALAFDAETGSLDVALNLPAAGTQLRWSAPKLVAAANERVRGATARALRVLAPVVAARFAARLGCGGGVGRVQRVLGAARFPHLFMRSRIVGSRRSAAALSSRVRSRRTIVLLQVKNWVHRCLHLMIRPASPLSSGVVFPGGICSPW
ncbi:hypothetical protein [Streptomyces sp. NPDC045714]|uniref:hypothetical protein n=1 Tax=Streptomyces sp. NPDC045714 TaxID=3154913 RepID=UPI00340251C8